MELKELNKHFNLVRKLQQVQEMYQTIEAKSLGAQALTGMPHGTGVSDKTGMLAAELADLSSRIQYLQKEVSESAPPVEAFINSIENDKIRLMFRFRFLYGLSWCEVADLFDGMTEANARNTCYDFLEDA